MSGPIPFVAVWMVTYNHVNFIVEAVESVMSQKTSFGFRLYIGEDFSNDGTRELCILLKNKYPKSIELLLNDVNLGPSRNALRVYDATYKSGAKYIAMLEGDDYWSDMHKLQKQIDFLERHPSFVLSFHPVLMKNNQTGDEVVLQSSQNIISLRDLLTQKIEVYTGSIVYQNVIEVPTQIIDFIFGDHLIYIMLSLKGNFYMLKDTMSVYRVHTKNTVSQTSSEKWATENVKFFHTIYSLIPETHLEEWSKGIYRHKMKLVKIYIRNGKLSSARSLLNVVVKEFGVRILLDLPSIVLSFYALLTKRIRG